MASTLRWLSMSGKPAPKPTRRAGPATTRGSFHTGFQVAGRQDLRVCAGPWAQAHGEAVLELVRIPPRQRPVGPHRLLSRRERRLWLPGITL